jgi:thioesterase domain-containing protein
MTGDVAIVGHSGAGAFLPAIASRLEGRVVSLLFVDAVVPPPSGVHETPARLRTLLDQQTVDGRLRRWLEWWPDDVVSELGAIHVTGAAPRPRGAVRCRPLHLG